MKGLKMLFGAATLAAAVVSQAADLTVPAGHTYTVGPAQTDLRLDHLTLGDNARIAFAPGVTSWRVYAKSARIGNNVVIDGRGAAGAAGLDGSDHRGSAHDCEKGRDGGNGAPGLAGGSGVNMNLWWHVDTLGSLHVLADGGQGGAGGRGGQGQNAGNVNLCEGPAGGNGGRGGQGGIGGNGGAVALHYYAGADTATAGSHIHISNAGGQPGTGGAGGAAGTGSEGKFQRTAFGDRWFKGGPAGSAGAAGIAGTRGNDGVVQMEALTSDRTPAWRDEIGSSAVPNMTVSQSSVPQSSVPQSSAAGSSQLLQSQPVTAGATPVDESVQLLLQRMQRRIDDLEQRVRILEQR